MRTLLAVVILLSVPVTARGADEWTSGDTARQAVYLTLHVADWAQTRHIARHPEEFTERNPVLGEHPSVGRVNGYFAATALAHTAVSWALPRGWREGWQYVTIGVESVVVARNYRLGVKFDF